MKLMGDARIIVTGSRNWIDVVSLVDAIDIATTDLLKLGAETVNLSVGDCPTGADKMAEAHYFFMHKQSGRVAKFVADWKNLGGAAGPARNKKMVQHGGNIVLAFAQNCEKLGCPRKPSPHISHGTASTINFAKVEEIPVTEITEKFPENYFKHKIYPPAYLTDLLKMSGNFNIFYQKHGELLS